MKFNILDLENINYVQVSTMSSSFSAGIGTPFNDGKTYEFISEYMIKNIKEPLVLVVSGDSMIPEFIDGDRCVIDFNLNVANGDYCAVYHNGDYLIKEFNESRRGYKLLSINPKYDPIEIKENDDFKVLGKVVGLERRFK